MCVDDEAGHAAVAGAAGSRDQNRDWMSFICGISKTMLDQNQIAAASRILQDHCRAGTKLANLDASQRPQNRAEGYAIQAAIEQCSAGALFG